MEVCGPGRHRKPKVKFLGLEAVTSALLVATLVYLDLAPKVRWDHINYYDAT